MSDLTKERGLPLAKTEWRTRKGIRVPRCECLPPMERIPAKDFAAWMESMMEGDEVGAP